VRLTDLPLAPRAPTSPLGGGRATSLTAFHGGATSLAPFHGRATSFAVLDGRAVARLAVARPRHEVLPARPALLFTERW